MGVAAGVKKYKDDVQFASQFPNMNFVVAQTGSLTMEDRQVGSFDVPMVRKLVGYAESAGVALKEHNADYLTAEQIQLRKQAGVHACNIAPQLGVIQTKTILQAANTFGVDYSNFYNAVLKSNRWAKWIIDGNDLTKVLVAGHYCFNSDQYRELENNLSFHIDIYQLIEDNIVACLNQYYTNLY